MMTILKLAAAVAVWGLGTGIAISHAAASSAKVADAQIELVENGVGIDIHHIWKFDETFSSELFENYDSDDDDGIFSKEDLDAIEQDLTTVLRQDKYFTEVSVGGERLTGLEPEKVSVAEAISRPVVSFTVGAPIQPKRDESFVIRVADPSARILLKYAGAPSVVLKGSTLEKCTASFQPIRTDGSPIEKEMFGDTGDRELGIELHVGC